MQTLEEKREKNKAISRRYYAAHREEIKDRVRRYDAQHKAEKHAYALLHKEEKRKRDAAYRARHPEKRKAASNEYHRAYYARNRKKILARCAKFYHSHKRELRPVRRRYQQNRAKTDLNFRLKRLLSIRILKALTCCKKSATTLNLLGASIQEVRQHLESKFLPGMSWKNHGFEGWHIDHIKPCASFDLTDPEQQKLCFHYSNLQPLWAKDNLEKSDKIV